MSLQTPRDSAAPPLEAHAAPAGAASTSRKPAFNWASVSGPAGAKLLFQNRGTADTVSSMADVAFVTYQDASMVWHDGPSVNFTVSAPPATNQPPAVSAGPDQTIILPNVAILNGSATDDGLPNPPGALTYTWTKVGGPSTVTFDNANAPATTASFGAPGTYTLKLVANDGISSANDNLVVTVQAAPTPTPTPTPTP